MKFNYSVEVDTDEKSIIISGNSSHDMGFSFVIEKDKLGYIQFRGKSPLDYYEGKVFRGGEWQYFERQKESFKYILGDIHSSNNSYPDEPNKKRKPRNGYRPVTVKENGREIKGYLIHFSQESICLLATVELENGRVYQFGACDIKFDDV